MRFKGLIGSGTVSNADHERVGSTCLSERRAIDVIAGRSPTPFLGFHDRVSMQAGLEGSPSPFGTIDQRVVPA